MADHSNRFQPALATLILIIAIAVTAVAGEEEPQESGLVDLAIFGTQVNSGTDVCVEWDEPRDVYQVHAEGVSAEVAQSLELQWWGGIWPNGSREDEITMGGAAGWMGLDDCYNGSWVRVAVEPSKSGDSGAWVFVLPVLGKEEWDQYLPPEKYSEAKCPTFRRTFKMRVVSKTDEPLPDTLRLLAFNDTRWETAQFDIEFRLPEDGQLNGRIDVINGDLESLKSLPSPRSVTISDKTWRAKDSTGRSAGVRVAVQYAHSQDDNSNDLTRVTVRLGEDEDAVGFSFVPEDVLAAGAIHLPDFDALIAPSDKNSSWANCPRPLQQGWGQRVRDRVAEHAEATRASAMAGIPRLAPPPPVPLGVPSARQEFLINAHGDWSTSLGSLWFDNGRDYPRWGLDQEFGKQIQGELQMVFDTRAEPAFDGGDREDVERSLEDGYLPIIHVQWHTGLIQYHHVLTTTILSGDYGDDVARRGDETVVLLTKLEMSNPSDEPEPAAVNLRYSNNTPLVLREDGLLALQASKLPEELVAQRGMISVGTSVGGGAEGWTVVNSDNAEVFSFLRYRTMLDPHETRAVYFKTAFVDVLEEAEIGRLHEIDFERESAAVREYWQKRLASGMRIETPDSAVNNFYKANLWHIAISTDRDPETGLYNQPVGTVGYKVYPNETVMIARSMDMRREHVEAERFIEPMLRYQGAEELRGRFSTKEGAFHSAGRYTDGAYAMDHGFVLWGVADHYLITRDRSYLDRVAPQLLKGCDFLLHERSSTMSPPDSPRSPVFGLVPPSSLEDVTEFKYWLAVNGYFYLGMKRTAEALADIAHPEAERVAEEAERYRADIETAARNAATRAAVVRLRNGTYIPYVPSRVGQWRHKAEGWVREALYPTLQLATAEVVPPTDRLMTWMLDELEDNLFFSAESGYNVTDCDETWFERGGVTMQPCLLDMPPIYMARDEIPAALRSFWNTYAMSLHPDVQCFAEWVPQFGVAGGPLYKTSDEARFVIWLRQLLLWENGSQLWFGRATPREWLEDGKTVRIENAATKFGVAGMTLRSEAAQNRIRASLQLPRQVPPEQVWLRLRHPGGKRPTRVLVDGRALSASSIVGEDVRLPPNADAGADRIEVVAEYQPE